MKMHDESFNRLFRTMIKPQSILGVLILFAVLFVWGDKFVAQQVASLTGLNYLKFITNLGNTKLWVIGLAVLFLLFKYGLKRRKAAINTAFLWFCVFVPDLINVFIKIGFGRARPEHLFNDGIYGFQWLEYTRDYWSFTSGHTTTIMGLVFGLWILFPKYRWWFFSVGCIVPITRVLLNQHYLSDVLVPIYLTLIEVGLIHILWQRLQAKYKWLN